jgi:glycosyltransferase involved in cell wall biosynthesis
MRAAHTMKTAGSIMRVLHVTGNIYRYNGSARQALSLASALQAFDCESAFLAHHSDSRSIGVIDGMRVYRAADSKISSLLAAVVCLIRMRPNVVHCHGFFVGACAACRIMGYPIVMKTTLRGVDDYESLRKVGRVQYWLARQVKANNALTEYIAGINRKHIAEDRVVVIPNGTYVPETSSIIKTSPPALVAIGQVIRRKRVDLAVEFFNRIGVSSPLSTLRPSLSSALPVPRIG